MKEKKDILTLQLLYAGLLADLLQILCDNGLLEKVSTEKQTENNLAAPARVKELKLKHPDDVFNFYSNVIGFAQWNSFPMAAGYSFKAKDCKLKSIARYLSIDSPCNYCCINPIASLCSALEIPYQIQVSRTLWDSKSCILFAINKTNNLK
ncbi:MAG: hypothetical protein C4539_14095 [Ignavibacteriales bacterium]|nr:MAG: hypothetical protein C4539_14095 [Ignavibacteriales bacterium]